MPANLEFRVGQPLRSERNMGGDYRRALTIEVCRAIERLAIAVPIDPFAAHNRRLGSRRLCQIAAAAEHLAMASRCLGLVEDA